MVQEVGHYELVAEFNDAAVSGADHIEARPGFAAMLANIASNGARIILVETASRFARAASWSKRLASAQALTALKVVGVGVGCNRAAGGASGTTDWVRIGLHGQPRRQLRPASLQQRRSFSAHDHRRRRCTDVITSTCALTSGQGDHHRVLY